MFELISILKNIFEIKIKKIEKYIYIYILLELYEMNNYIVIVSFMD